jgi:toxin ParE1/3/4
MRFEVLLTEAAQRDVEAIHDYVATHDSAAKAAHMLDRIEEVFESLASYPERGTFPKELVAIGIREYRETYFKPYRVIYGVMGRRVLVYLVADGRRDMQTLLQRRLLG